MSGTELKELVRGWRRKLATGAWRSHPPEKITVPGPVYDALLSDAADGGHGCGYDLGAEGGLAVVRIPVEREQTP